MNLINYVQYQLQAKNMKKTTGLLRLPTVLFAFFLIVSVLLSGCATTVSDCDPAVRKNTLATASCIFSDNGYKARQISLEASLAEEKSLAESQRQIYALLKLERSGVSKSLSRTRAQYKKLTKTLNDLIAQISKNSQGNKAIQQKIDTLKNKMSTLDNSTSSAQKKLALSALYAEVDSLKKELGYQ